jgi:E3 ubiquitin-protein ligase RNF13
MGMVLVRCLAPGSCATCSSDSTHDGVCRPILTFIVLLILPSALTLATLLIHRFRVARAERRERAPEDVVQRLPWRIWTGNGWEKHSGPVPLTRKKSNVDLAAEIDLERNAAGVGVECICAPERAEIVSGDASTSHEDIRMHEELATVGPPLVEADEESINPPWFDAQTECAICLNDFAKGDRVRVLPCKHIFHLDEIDEWLIHRRKLVSDSIISYIW